ARPGEPGNQLDVGAQAAMAAERPRQRLEPRPGHVAAGVPLTRVDHRVQPRLVPDQHLARARLEVPGDAPGREVLERGCDEVDGDRAGTAHAGRCGWLCAAQMLPLYGRSPR